MTPILQSEIAEFFSFMKNHDCGDDPDFSDAEWNYALEGAAQTFMDERKIEGCNKMAVQQYIAECIKRRI